MIPARTTVTRQLRSFECVYALEVRVVVLVSDVGMQGKDGVDQVLGVLARSRAWSPRVLAWFGRVRARFVWPIPCKLGARKDMASPINFNQFLEKEKLKSNGRNFDWFRHVRIFLNGGNLQYVLDAPLGDPPAETETDEVKNVYATRKTRYKNFVMNYNMNMNKELPELFAMLKSAEIGIKKEHQVLMVNKTTSFKKQGKSKGKNKKSGKKAATPPVKPKAGPKPDAECYYCKEKGHWKRNCSKYLADLKSGLVKKKKEGISIYML
ncbi:hypothetical protein QYE76_056077 [Lolium multiflorum]|uniref:CCHC-type domain-containing protein n=1 Tax=Lolium multiflorum TaxID=4521 RepID=A0AAD8T0Y1_LOLMU|nr:hypothetical protein QYE76_056077 [Lolium multiflorum]